MRIEITHYRWGYFIQPVGNRDYDEVRWCPTRAWAENKARRMLTQYTTGTLPKETWYVED